jgi:hypothetical protein
MSRNALFVTYAMSCPRVVGVLFRALRLALELDRRGWRSIILHEGPVPDDPKVRQRPSTVALHPARPRPGLNDVDSLFTYFDAFAPGLVVFGEGPITATRVLFDAARRLRAPFVLLDQYYGGAPVDERHDLDLVLLYALGPFWPPDDRRLGRRCLLIPPFIGAVTAVADLPVPAAIGERPWIGILGFDPGVLRAGIALASEVGPEPAVITVSSRPADAAALMADAGIEPGRAVALGLLSDPDLFGLVRACRTCVLANGFMQIMEALALGCPAVCIDRGVGLPAWQLDDRFKAYASIGEPPDIQRQRLAGWLCASPFSAELSTALAAERDGARVAADGLEAVADRSRRSLTGWLRARRRRVQALAPFT